MAETSRLRDVNNVYAGYGPPPVVDTSYRPTPLDDRIREIESSDISIDVDNKGQTDSIQDLELAIISLGRHLRKSSRPSTALHALLLDDGLTVGQIAARAELDPIEVEIQLAPLVSVGLVHRSASGVRPRFTIPGISTE